MKVMTESVVVVIYSNYWLNYILWRQLEVIIMIFRK